MTRPEQEPEVPPASGPGVGAVSGAGSTAPDTVPARRTAAFSLGAVGIVLLPGGLLAFAWPAAPGRLLWWAAAWIAIAALLWLVDARTPRRWVGWALLAAVPPAVVAVLAAVPAGLVPLVASPILALLADRWFTRPAKDLAERDVEIPVPLDAPGGGRLLIGRDRVVLAGAAHVRQALPLAELAFAQAGELRGEEAGWWPLPGGTGVPLRPGPAVRLVAGAQQWMLCVADPQLVAAIVRRRATAAWPLRTGPRDLDAWRQLREWAAAPRRTVRRGFPDWQLVVGGVLAVSGTLLLATTSGHAEPVRWVVAVVASALGGLLASAWFRARRRLDFAELHHLPPGSPAWGEVRLDHAPLPNWRPWHPQRP
ncbi:hypothetical protein GCM10011581_37500 [Saccharopolyspora subtropica]|uniref:Uncharacterized protein n=1 Tax=Saccharopolyspora thermophila TaxID=89367 RepID=A0A917K0W4_9PSEU|nr:hypothetical protein [Saccharopolyspora subtropica]GGI96827.1 hypothetical protein GCM10011581_37500 [Saccharopolyspora subtropica]